MKNIFFKSVRKDGSSLYAIGKYKKKYKLGQTYIFDEKTPAHVFVVCKDIEFDSYQRILTFQDESTYDLHDIPLDNQQLIYNYRAESSVAEKVIICYGELKIRNVPICDIDENWDFEHEYKCSYTDIFTSTSFTVIGQIVPQRQHVADEGRIPGLKIIKDIS